MCYYYQSLDVIINHAGDNPVFNASVDALQEEVKSVGEENPVAAFLESEEFKSVMPRSPKSPPDEVEVRSLCVY